MQAVVAVVAATIPLAPAVQEGVQSKDEATLGYSLDCLNEVGGVRVGLGMLHLPAVLQYSPAALLLWSAGTSVVDGWFRLLLYRA